MTNYEIALLVAPAATYLGALVLLLRIETRRQDSKTASLPGQLPEHAGKNVKPVRDPHVPDFSTPRDSGLKGPPFVVDVTHLMRSEPESTAP